MEIFNKDVSIIGGLNISSKHDVNPSEKILTLDGLDNVKYRTASELISDLGSSDKHHIHYQNSALSTWTVAHNLQKHPAVSVTDSGGSLVVGNINYPSLNTVEITFNASFSGIAYFN